MFLKVFPGSSAARFGGAVRGQAWWRELTAGGKLQKCLTPLRMNRLTCLHVHRGDLRGHVAWCETLDASRTVDFGHNWTSRTGCNDCNEYDGYDHCERRGLTDTPHKPGYQSARAFRKHARCSSSLRVIVAVAFGDV